MSARRGLTLLEVMLSAALLAVLAAAVVPLLTQALQTLRDDGTSEVDFELQRIADAACLRSSDHDFRGDAFVIGAQEQQRLLQAADARSIRLQAAITVKRLGQTAAGAGHFWIDFEREGLHAYRWIGTPHVSSQFDRGEPPS